MNRRLLKTLIKQYTKLSKDHLTPELGLHLITPECPLWAANADSSPFHDPFWAFYWPGGQALTRYILDNPKIFYKRNVLDVGSGCGSAALASKLVEADRVVANDIDPAAAVAIEMNMKANGLEVTIDTENYLATPIDSQYDFVLMGDMFYDPDFAHIISNWIKTMAPETKVLIGDPGRLPFVKHPMKKALEKMADYDLPRTCQLENNGLSSGYVWMFQKFGS